MLSSDIVASSVFVHKAFYRNGLSSAFLPEVCTPFAVFTHSFLACDYLLVKRMKLLVNTGRAASVHGLLVISARREGVEIRRAWWMVCWRLEAPKACLLSHQYLIHVSEVLTTKLGAWYVDFPAFCRVFSTVYSVYLAPSASAHLIQSGSEQVQVKSSIQIIPYNSIPFWVSF